MNRKTIWVIVLMAIFTTHTHGQDMHGEHAAFRVQVGAFRVPANAQGYFTRLNFAGFSPVLERHGDLYRVIVPAMALEEVEDIVQRLGNTGFRNVWVRREGMIVQVPAAAPSVPLAPDVYRVQIGAFRDPANAQTYFNRLQFAGFSPVLEQFNSSQHGEVTRVFISGVRASERLEIAQRLRNAGFDGTWAHGEGTVARITDVQIETQNWVSISATDSYTVAVRKDGTLWAWGSKVYDGMIVIQDYGTVPVQIGTEINWAYVSAGRSHAVALRTDGTLWAWGNNSSGQLGDGTTNQRNRPVRIGTATSWAAVSAGSHNTFAVRTDGSLWAWGRKPLSAPHHGEQQFIMDYGNTPVRIGTDTNWAAASADEWHTVAVRTDGSIWVWGCNFYFYFYSQLDIIGVGSGHVGPIQIGWETDWAYMDIDGITVAVRTGADGSLWARSGASNVRVRRDTDLVSVLVGMGHPLVIREGDTLWTLGGNRIGQLGGFTITNRNIPTRTEVATEWGWASVSAGRRHTVAIKANGTLWGWGSNIAGELGVALGTNEWGKRINSHIPIQVGADTNWTSVSISCGLTVAIRADGTLWGWGASWHDQLGVDLGTNEWGERTNSHIPIQMGRDTNWASVSAGSGFTVAIRTDGTLWAWGRKTSFDFYETTSIIVTDYGNTPIQIGTATNWTSVFAGDSHTVALKNDGSLWAWGSNMYGQLGDGTVIDRLVPIRIGTDSDWASVSTGFNFTMAIKADNTLWAWGNNQWWHFGDGTGGSVMRSDVSGIHLTPTQLGTEANWVHVSANMRGLRWRGSGIHIVAVRTDGSMWAWGRKIDASTHTILSYGNTPTRIGSDINWASVSAGSIHTVAIREDGSLWAWGMGFCHDDGMTYGLLGHTMLSESFTPVQIWITPNQASISTSEATELAKGQPRQQNKQQFDSEVDFRWEKLGNGVIITGYVGKNTDVRIPPQIQGMPVIGIGAEAFIGRYRDWETMEFVTEHQLTSIDIPNSVSVIGDGAFAQNQLTSITIPDSVSHIGGRAFSGNRLTSVAIPNSVSHIGHGAFAQNQLASITIPDSVPHIGSTTFYRNQLTSITIGSNVTIRWDRIMFSDFISRFDSFLQFYEDNGHRAGTFDYINGNWSVRF